MRIGIIGCGKIGLGGHAHAFRAIPGVEVVAVADPTPERLALARQELGLDASRCYLDYRDLLTRADLDAVSVTTPQNVRAPIVVAACQAGKHVLSEKPLATTPADADRMIEAARTHQVTLAINHNYLFFPEYLAIKEMIQAGEIGEVALVILNWLGVEDRPGSAEYRPLWRHDVAVAGGGVLMDMLHCVYVATWLVGSPIRMVSAAVDQRRNPSDQVEDLALCRFEHQTGFSLVNVAWGEGPGSTEVMGSHGRIIQLNAGFGTTPFARHERLVVINERGIREPVVSSDRHSLAVYEDFVAAIREGRRPRATGEDGKAVLEAVLAAYTSAATRRDVPVPFPVDHPVYQKGALGIADLLLAPDSRVATRQIFRRPSATGS